MLSQQPYSIMARKATKGDSVCYSKAEAAVILSIIMRGQECDALLQNTQCQNDTLKQLVSIKDSIINNRESAIKIHSDILKNNTETIECLNKSLNKQNKTTNILLGVSGSFALIVAIETLILIIK